MCSVKFILNLIPFHKVKCFRNMSSSTRADQVHNTVDFLVSFKSLGFSQIKILRDKSRNLHKH